MTLDYRDIHSHFRPAQGCCEVLCLVLQHATVRQSDNLFHYGMGGGI